MCKSQSRALQIAAYHLDPGIEGLRGAEVIKACRLERGYEPFACRRRVGSSHQDGVGRAGPAQQAAEEKWPEKSGGTGQEHLMEGAVRWRHDPGALQVEYRVVPHLR